MPVLLMLLLIQAPVTPPGPQPKPPDCSAPVHRQFDFWVGEWDVVPNGPPPPAPAPPASNIITREYGNCVVMEHWTAPGQTGSSFNIYDRSRGQWHQTWVDSSGGLHEYWGELKDGHMVFMGQVPLGSGASAAGRRTVRLTLFNLGPDKVRQLSEGLNPDGSWTVNYDLIYTRRKPRQGA